MPRRIITALAFCLAWSAGARACEAAPPLDFELTFIIVWTVCAVIGSILLILALIGVVLTFRRLK